MWTVFVRPGSAFVALLGMLAVLMLPACGGGSEGPAAAGDLPAGFPEFPSLPGAVILSDFSEPPSFVVLLQHPGTVDETASYYEEQLPAAGWTITDRVEIAQQGALSISLEVSGHDLEGRVLMIESDETEGVGIEIALDPIP